MNWVHVLSMPLLAGFIGYTTKLVAIEMMFRPTYFRGVRPYLGWQGIIPRNAGRIGSIAVNLLFSRLIDPKQILGRLDPNKFSEQLRGPLNDAVTQMGTDLMTKYQPQLWNALPTEVRKRILAQIAHRAPDMVAELLAEFAKDPETYLDSYHMAMANLASEPGAISRLMRSSGRNGFRFIARSGLYFGLAIGLLQAGVWTLTHEPLVMPIFGAFVGLSTDWVALKMLFLPHEERRFLGLFRWQGLFQRQRDSVADDYGRIVAEEVLTVPKIMEELLTGPRSDRLVHLVQRHVSRVVDRQVGVTRPLVVLTIGSERYQEFKADVAAQALGFMPTAMDSAMDYAKKALDVEETVVRAMHALSRDEFESVLRPAFRQDEWKLVVVGGVLGAIVGELQVLLLLH
jgi:uncharacterized membrane protein YheB (UPF0754 family)